MDLGVLAAFVLFAAAMVLTPGPNNLLAIAQGASFGVRRTLPFLGGAVAGFALLVAIMFAGAGALITSAPGAIATLKILGALYLLWLAWRIGRAEPETGGQVRRFRPIGFGEALLIQWLNPKGWMMALAAIGAYSGMSRSPLLFSVVGVAVFALLMFPAMLLWTMAGAGIARLRPGAIRLANRVMAGLLVVSVGLIFLT